MMRAFYCVLVCVTMFCHAHVGMTQQYQFGSATYTLYNDPTSIYSATQACENRGQHLAAFRDRDVALAIEANIFQNARSKHALSLILEFLPFTSWSRGNAFVSGARSLMFKSRAGHVGHSAANGSPPLHHFFERICVARTQCRRDWPRKLVTRFSVKQRE